MTIANGDSAMRDGAQGASAASIMRSQAKDREREKRQSRQQYE
jgi:phosphoribosylformylglycinamidine (FGAM) synthase-like enzyme